MTPLSDDGQSPAAVNPQRRRVRAGSNTQESQNPISGSQVRQQTNLPEEELAPAEQANLYRLRQGWLNIADLTHLCCVNRSTCERWFQRLNPVPFERTGLPGRDARSRFVRRVDLENELGEEGWRVVRNQQGDPEVLAALMGNSKYPLLSQLLTWSQETPRRKLPLLDLALELQLTPSAIAFYLNREIDWADQAGLMRDELKRTDRLAVATLSSSRPRNIDYNDLVTLETWSIGKPFQEETTRALARQGRLEHLHGVVSQNGGIAVWLLPSWAEILKEAEPYTPIHGFELPSARSDRLQESRTVIDTAVNLGILRTYQWGRSTYVESRPLTNEERQTVEQHIDDQKRARKIEQVSQRSQLDYEQIRGLESRLGSLSDADGNIEINQHELKNIRRMVTVARMKAEGQTLEACGEWLGVTRERARQIIQKYERRITVCQSFVEKTSESLLNLNEQTGSLPPAHQRLAAALIDGSSSALLNQLFIEREIFGGALEVLSLPPVKPYKPVTTQTPSPSKSNVAFSTASSEQSIDQARRLKTMIEQTLDTAGDTLRRSARVKVIQEECEIACLAAEGKDERVIGNLFYLTPRDVQYVLRKHRTKLGLLESEGHKFVKLLSKVSDLENLPQPILRLVHHCQMDEPYALLNALFIENEIFGNDIRALLQLFPNTEEELG